MATNGDDFIQFQGMMGQLTITLVNPYDEDEEVSIDGNYFINTGAYDGLDGYDRLNFNSIGDVLFIRDETNTQVVFNIEEFIANDGGDIIILADSTIDYGDVIIRGGSGDDILWSNSGNDQVFGGNGDDNIHGGPGNDLVSGNAGNDRVSGSDGDDMIIGGTGNDVLFGAHEVAPEVWDKDFTDDVTFPHLMEGVNLNDLMPPGTNALGINADNLSVDFQAQATLTFREGFAGYNNSMGVYEIGEDGTILNVTMLWENVKDAGIGVAHTIDLPVGEDGGQFGFFIIADGDRVNSGYSGLDTSADGVLSFIYDLGGANERAATVHDNGSMVSMVYDDGSTVRILSGDHYHTTERGGDTSINSDGATHMVSGLVDIGQTEVLRIGFEDLKNLGDADFEDVFFDLNIEEVIVEGDSENGNDTLVGGAGDDIMYGNDGDDILVMGDGLDHAYGGRGSDQFIYDIFDSMVDTIHDFELGAGMDVLNITDILEGYDALTDAISDFVQVVSLNGDTHVNVNADGDIGGEFSQMVVLSGVDNATLADMINNGNLVADQSVVV